jgi:TRAP-type C4-dicarboxylate transport system permease small subunit
MENLARWLHKINVIFGFVAAAAIAMMIISTTVDVSSRYIFNNPIAGVFELNEVLLVIAVFLTVCWTQESRGHTRVVLIMRRFSMRNAIKLDTLCWVLCFIFLAVIGWQSAKEALRSYEINEFRWGSVQMQIWWAKALVPMGCWLGCLQLVVDIWVNFRRLSGALPLDLPELRQIGE